MSTKENITFKVKTSVYPLSAVMTASYIFLEKAYVYLDKGTKDEIVVELKGKQPLNAQEKEALKGEFNNELLNCTLREKIATDNAKIREYIVGQALYSSVQDMSVKDEGTEDLDDPLEIAVPWEEKYGEKAKKKSAKKSKAKVKSKK